MHKLPRQASIPALVIIVAALIVLCAIVAG